MAKRITITVLACRKRGCLKPARIKGLCEMHDKRERRAKKKAS